MNASFYETAPFLTRRLCLVLPIMLTLLFSWRVQAQSVDCTDEVTTGVPLLECEALVALYTSTDGANWSDNTNWLSTEPVNAWYGVGAGGGHVGALNLRTNFELTR